MHSVDSKLSDRVLGHGEGLIVAFPIQTAEDIQVSGAGVTTSISTVKAFFFKIVKTQEFLWRYTQLGAINSGTANALDYNYLGDTGHGTGDDVLRLVNDDWKVYHLGVGLHSTELRVYEDLDPSTPNRAVDHSNQNEPDPTAGDQFGFYDGKMQSDRHDPPVHTERLSIRSDTDGQFLRFGFYADANVADGNTDLELIGRTYQLRPVLDPDEQAYMLSQNRLRRAGQPIDLKVITIQIGGIFPYEIGTSLPNGWGDLKSELSQDLDYPSGRGASASDGGASQGGSSNPSPREPQHQRQRQSY